MLFKQDINESNMRSYYPAVFAESAKEDLSQRYLYVSTSKLLDGLKKEGFKIIGAKQQGAKLEANKRHAKHQVFLTHDSLESQNLLVGQELPMLAVTNSHNGRSAFKLDTAFFRLACSNGLLMPSGKLNSAAINHTKNFMGDIIEACYRVITEFPNQANQISEMKQVLLTYDEKHSLAEAAKTLVFDEAQDALNKERGIDLTSRLLQVRRSEDRKDDLWSTFNVIQENVIKGGFKVLSASEDGSKLHYSKTRAVKSIDRDAQLNKALMTLALEMKKLKTGAA